jgi:hypothetical protein
MADPQELIDAASRLLVAIENTFNTNGVDLPERRYITLGGPGSVAYDCAQLTVSWEQTYSGLPGQQQQVLSNCEGPRSGIFLVELVREIPVSQRADMPPEGFLIQEAAEGLMRDAALLYDGGMLATDDTVIGKGLVAVSAGMPAGALQSLIMTVEMMI